MVHSGSTQEGEKSSHLWTGWHVLSLLVCPKVNDLMASTHSRLTCDSNLTVPNISAKLLHILYLPLHSVLSTWFHLKYLFADVGISGV